MVGHFDILWYFTSESPDQDRTKAHVLPLDLICLVLASHCNMQTDYRNVPCPTYKGCVILYLTVTDWKWA